jgi:glycosyltransferase involved in cell wall biosynthesis
MSEQIPTVSVLMTTYKNAPAVVSRAVESVLNQTYGDLELILVFEPNDPATSVIREKYRHDSRLVLIENEKRLGRSESYNLGLRLARGRYLARMDADDYSYPGRLERQIAFLRDHPEVSVLGANARILDHKGSVVGVRRFPLNHADIVKVLIFANPMLHPTIVWDRDQVGREVQFDQRFSRFCDDLELWMRFIAQGHRFANLPDVLLDYQQPENHRRPRNNWRLNFKARLVHWRLALRHPGMLVGILAFGILALMPNWAIEKLTGRSRFSDKLRCVEN